MEKSSSIFSVIASLVKSCSGHCILILLGAGDLLHILRYLRRPGSLSFSVQKASVSDKTKSLDYMMVF